MKLRQAFRPYHLIHEVINNIEFFFFPLLYCMSKVELVWPKSAIVRLNDYSFGSPPEIAAIFNFHQRMSWLLAAVAAVISFWVISLARILSSSSCVPPDPGFLHSGYGKRRNVLLVIAHPDDESMFFTPTILFLKYGGHNIHILCMSTGNADGVGNTRKDEIYQACSILKVPLQQVKVLDHPGFQDGFNETWDHGLLAKLIQNEVRVWNIDLLISFDKFGVSGHPNHRAVHHGICMLLSDSNQKYSEAWELVSLSIFRKYSGPVDVWLSIIFSSFYSRKQVYCLLNNNPSLSFLAMAAHRSQWIWFRKLFVGFSTYTYMNTLRKINVE